VDGWTLLAEGRQAEVFVRPDGTVVKLMRDPADHLWIEREAAALQAVAAAGLAVPEVVAVLEVDGRPGLAMTRVEGADLMTLMGAKPWLVASLGSLLGRLHAALNGIRAPDELPVMADVLAGHVGEAVGLSDSQRTAALHALEELPVADRLCHGDLHLANLIGDRAHPVVIDWGGATRGDPTADVALTVLMHRMAKPGPHAPPLVRTLAPVGARIIVRRYLAAYRRVRPVDPDRLERWIAVHAAARLAHGIDEEGPGLRAVVADAFGP
jgi:aminoglycoside phosphotransferase (APT) family kinase protein